MKSWRDVEEAALTEPILYQLVTLVERGDLTREQALIAAVLGMVTVKEQQRAMILELINTRLPSPFVLRNPFR